MRGSSAPVKQGGVSAVGQQCVQHLLVAFQRGQVRRRAPVVVRRVRHVPWRRMLTQLAWCRQTLQMAALSTTQHSGVKEAVRTRQASFAGTCAYVCAPSKGLSSGLEAAPRPSKARAASASPVPAAQTSALRASAPRFCSAACTMRRVLRARTSAEACSSTVFRPASCVFCPDFGAKAATLASAPLVPSTPYENISPSQTYPDRACSG